MSPAEIAVWSEMLGPTLESRLNSITDLLHHAIGDRMSADDRGICVAERKRLRAEILAAKQQREDELNEADQRMV